MQFNYRLMGFEKWLTVDIPAGGQVEMPHDFLPEERDAVIKQLEHFGGAPKSDLASLIAPRGLLYSERVMASDLINTAREIDTELRQKVSDAESQHAGMVTNQSVIGQLKEATTEIRQMESTSMDFPQRGGVDTKVTVSREAGPGAASRG